MDAVSRSSELLRICQPELLCIVQIQLLQACPAEQQTRSPACMQRRTRSAAATMNLGTRRIGLTLLVPYLCHPTSILKIVCAKTVHIAATRIYFSVATPAGTIQENTTAGACGGSSASPRPAPHCLKNRGDQIVRPTRMCSPRPSGLRLPQGKIGAASCQNQGRSSPHSNVECECAAAVPRLGVQGLRPGVDRCLHAK